MTNTIKVAALAAFGALLIAGFWASSTASAHEPHEGLQFSIGVRGVDGCNTRSSDVSCTLPQGQPFVLEVYLDELPDDIETYDGFDIWLEYEGVTPNQDASNDEWPDCGFPASAYNEPGIVLFGCARGVPPAGPSSYIGPIGTNSFNCVASGSISMIHGKPVVGGSQQSDTVLYENLDETHAEGTGTSEKITIDCGTLPSNTPGEVTGGTPGPPGPTPQQLRTPLPGQTTPGGPTLDPTQQAAADATIEARGSATPLGSESPTPEAGGGSDDDNSNAWIWIVIVAVVAVVVIGGGGYLYMRNRGGGTPPAGGTPAGGNTPPADSSGTAAGGATPPTSSGAPPANDGGAST